MVQLHTSKSMANDDEECEKYMKAHPYNYRTADTFPYIYDRLSWELFLLKKFPRSYIPYHCLGITYWILGGKFLGQKGNPKQALKYADISIRHLNRALSLSNDKRISAGITSDLYKPKVVRGEALERINRSKSKFFSNFRK